MKKALVIDNDEDNRLSLESVLKRDGFKVYPALGGAEGIALLREQKFDIVLTGLAMPGLSGFEVLREISSQKTYTPALVVTTEAAVQAVVEAMKMGASDYITKPFIPEELIITVNRALAFSKLQKDNILMKQQLKKKYNYKDIIGDSPQMHKVYELIDKVADTDSTILITGESGTGKELVAKTIHYNSTRSGGPFVPINCAAIPRELLESELFGHEKGAFTGAVNVRAGRFELAQGGTIFLDEIGELAPSLQVKLLRVLQEMEFERVGGLKTIKLDVRVLAATNRDIEQAVKEGNFREDLFYRLNVIPVHISPLRNRAEDIALLVDYFMQEFSKKRKRAPLAFSPDAMECVLKYAWPGNVRELKNLIERLTILVNGSTVKVPDLPEKFYLTPDCRVETGNNGFEMRDYINRNVEIPEDGISLNSVVGDMERNLILKALEKTGGVRSRAAALLGLNRTTLIEKMRKMNIEMKGSKRAG